MVGCLNGIVYRTIIDFQILADQNVVDTDIQTVFIIGNTQPIPRFDECILQFVRQYMMGLRNGGIIEVSA